MSIEKPRLSQEETNALLAMLHNLKQDEPTQSEIHQLREEIKKLREEAERSTRYAIEDRERLAEKVREASEKQASESARKTVRETLQGLGINPDQPADFINVMTRVRKFFEDVDSARKHAVFAFIGAVMLAVTAGFWQTIKAGILKP